MTKAEFIKRYGIDTYQQKLLKKKQYRALHKEQLKQYDKKYQSDHKEHYKQYQRTHNSMFAYCLPDQVEQIENYDAAKQDNFNGWCIHHRFETCCIVPYSRQQLIDNDLYYNRPASELIFLRRADHTKLHNIRRKQHKEFIEQIYQKVP